ncbi:type II CRISPR RNA-guided endonuclease Cas9 [Bifidobacterium choloepi]|nr:type II CRISPR RNA-guided endonuclease Cas9 [Bifidobacterium choloepi]
MTEKSADFEYAIGLDLGTTSVGFVAMKPDYKLVRAKGREIIGVRLFNSADSAAKRRTYRTTRRRLARRKWRLRFVDNIFASAITGQDPNFFKRRQYSWVHRKDAQNRDHYYQGLIFDSLEDDKRFYACYPTMYHLRKDLMEHDTDPRTGQPFDIREIYMAIHHLIKFRGHFLISGSFDASKTFDAKQLITLLQQLVHEFATEEHPANFNDVDANEIKAALIDTHHSRSARVNNTLTLFGTLSKTQKEIVKQALVAIVGNKPDFAKIFGLTDIESSDNNKYKFPFNDKNIDSKSTELENLLDEDDTESFRALRQMYDAITLMQLLGENTTLSDAMIQRYETHKRNWETCKTYLRNDFNKEVVNHNYLVLTHQWNKLEKPISMTQRDNECAKAKKFFEKLITDSSLDDKKDLLRQLADDALFPLERSSDNGVIPHQLHLHELHVIIERQRKYYPFLADTVDVDDGFGKKHTENRLEALLKFRVPYYVGPLVAPDNMKSGENAENHWMIRKDPSDKTAITPWNIGKVIDYDASARQFIERLTEDDTYLIGEPTLPKNSLIYQEYEVLSELNNCRVQNSSDKRSHPRRLTPLEKDCLVEVFKRHKTVTCKRAQNALLTEMGTTYTISGLSDPTKFVSSLSSYINLSEIFGSAYVESHRAQMEQCIEIQTVFEDQTMIAHQLGMIEGLTSDDIDRISRVSYTGWGRLSRKLLTSRIAKTKLSDDFEPTMHSILEIMRNSGSNLMEILADTGNGVHAWIDKQNRNADLGVSLEEQIDDMRVSPAAKRGVRQAINVIDDIADAVGHYPSRIFLETADDMQPSRRAASRKSKLESLYKNSALNKEYKELFNQLQATNNREFTDRMYLYYTQLGKDMYTGEPIDIDRISTAYDIDHIVPQAKTKNDSFDNRVLVSRKENARKSDSMLYTTNTINRMRDFWKQLLDMGLISQKKFQSLTRTEELSLYEQERFVNRSLVDTRQIIRNVSTLLRQRYGTSTAVTGMNSSITGDMRQYLGFVKDRDINDYHHAQDALCITAAGYFMSNRGFFDNQQATDTGANPLFTNSFSIYLNNYLQDYRESLSNGKRANPFGFVVGSMCSHNEVLRTNPATGEVVWNDDNASYLRHVMGYRKMLVTYKTYDDIGKLYDETRQPRGGKKLIPAHKEQEETALYGGFTNGTVACAVLLADRKGNAFGVNIPMSMYQEYLNCREDNDLLLALLMPLDPKKIKGASILLNHLPKNQLMKYRNAYMLFLSATELGNAQQLWLDGPTYDTVHAFLKNPESVDPNSIQHAFETILDAMQRFYPLYPITSEKRAEALRKFAELPIDKQHTDLQNLLHKVLHAAGSRANLQDIGLGSDFGRYRTFKPADDDCFIMQTPSGLTVQSISVSELKKKAGLS